MGDFSFPILTPQDVELFFNEVAPEIALKANDFKTLKPERFEQIWVTVLERMAGISVDQIRTRPFASEPFDHPEIHERTLFLVTLARVMARYMFSAKAEGFLLKDIVTPKPKRALRFLSAAINFYRFCEGREHVIHQIKEDGVKKKVERERLQQKNDELRAKQNNLRVKTAESEEAVKQLHEESDALEERMSQFHRENATEQKIIAELKSGIAESKQAAAQKKNEILKLKEEEDKLSKLIVQSPDRMRREMENEKRKLLQMKALVDEKMKRLIELKENNNTEMTQMLGNTELALKLITSIHNEIEKEKELQVELRKIREQYQVCADSLKENSAKDEQMRVMMANKHDKLSKLSLQQEHKMASLREFRKQIFAEKEVLERGVSSALSEKQMSYKTAQESLKKKIKEYQEDLQSKKVLYEQLLNVIDAYHVALGTNWEKMMEDIQRN